MKNIIFKCLVAGFLLIPQLGFSQKTYFVNSGELIFSWSDVVYADVDIHSNMRFTCWFHLGEYVNFDFGNNFGMYTGISVRNIGFITEENDVKTKFRSYTLGVPLAFKLGNLEKNTYVFGGAEYEMLFHYKQKTFVGDTKTKYGEWFSDRTNMFLPSVFGGIQFPGGPRVKFQYYFDDFLNHDYFKASASGDPAEDVDFRSFDKTQVFFVSLGFWLPYDKIPKPKNMGTSAAL